MDAIIEFGQASSYSDTTCAEDGTFTFNPTTCDYNSDSFGSSAQYYVD